MNTPFPPPEFPLPPEGADADDDAVRPASGSGEWSELGTAERGEPKEHARGPSRSKGAFEFEWEVGQWWMNGVVRRLRGLNALAVPFLEDEAGDGEDNYSLQPAPKPLGVPQLMGIAFFAVSGSAYGIEETVSVAGPFLTVVALIAASLLW